VRRAKPRCCESDLLVNRHHSDGQALDEFEDALDGVFSSAGRTYETLGKRRGSHPEAIAPADGIAHHRSRSSVVRVVPIEESDDDSCVEVNQAHSERNSSR